MDWQNVIDALARDSWVVIEDFLPEVQIDALADEVTAAFAGGRMRAAGVGWGRDRVVRPEIRADRVCWMDPKDPSVAQVPYCLALDELRGALNRMLFLGLRRFEGHMTVYPPGGHYARHVDQFAHTRHRRVSTVFYLNRNWDPAWGGQLRLFDPACEESLVHEVFPVAGRLVLFLADKVPHEVAVTQRERLSLTGWFRDDDDVLF